MSEPTNDSAATTIVGEVRSLFETHGSDWYGGEAVSQLQHGLQAAMFAEREGASPQLIVAALLHDVGHLLHNLPEDAADRGIDDRHEVLGTTWLRQRFGTDVSEPVGMHVVAKRYLCAIEPDYTDELSPASQLSLRLQGGPMTAAEIEEFESRPHFADAVQLRRWDDAAKVVDLQTPSLQHFISHIEIAATDATP